MLISGSWCRSVSQADPACSRLSSDDVTLPQENVDSFTVSATKCARRMATFVKILNKEDISTIEDRESIREVS